MHPNRHSRQRPGLRNSRRGFTTPAVALAMLVTMCGLALILDRLWLDAADLELTTAAEIAALQAASELATDDLFKPPVDPEARLDEARQAAAWIASQNVVAGDPVILDPEPEGDIRLGRLVLDDQTGLVRFEESSDNPTTAVVTALRTRRTSNPVALFVSGATGIASGDLATRVEATVDNRVRAVRPCEGTPVPALPLAIWKRDPSGRRLDTWENQIEARKGLDQFGYDSITHSVTSGPDGIPEIVLRCQSAGQSAVNANLLVVDLGTGLKDDGLKRQYLSGWTVDDLASLGGEMPLLPSGLSLNASAEFRATDRGALQTLLGEPRICLLFDAAAPTDGNDSLLKATCVRLVAIRILDIRDQGNGLCEIVAQPCVVKTKTAVLDVTNPYSTDSVQPVSPYTASPASQSSANASTGNPYIYKLQLSQ